MKRFFKSSKRIIALMIVLLMCFSVNVFADDNFQEMEAQVIQSEGNYGRTKIVFKDENGEIFNSSEDLEFSSSMVRRKASALPSKFDARDVDGVNYVTSVKNQGNYGTCWTFGANSALEARAIEMGLGSASNVDFSEAFLAWFGYNSYISNTSSGMYGDGIATKSKGKIPMDVIADLGGNPSFSIAAYSVGSGINNESDFPYSIVQSGSSIAESKRYNSEFRLLEGKTILDYYPNGMTESERNNYINTIKTALIKYKVLDCGAYYPGSSSEFVNIDKSKNIYAQYQTAKGYNGYALSNHEVSIIGYDDNFSKENFNAKNQPKGDGAWLIKNSWGSNIVGGGYTWISYYDESVSDITAYEIGDKSTYDYTYQYDGAIPTYSIGLRSSSLSTANVFTASRNETLNRVGFYTVDSNTDYTISVYKNLTSKSKPTSGTKVATVSGNADFSGYHTVPIDNTTIKKGNVFSIVVEFTNPNGNAFTFIEKSGSTQLFYGENVYVHQDAKINQSFVKSGSIWVDLKSGGYGNVSIKAFSKKIPINSINFNEKEKSTYVYESINVNQYSTMPENATVQEMSYTSSDESIATVDKDGKVTGVSEGSVDITVTANDGENQVTDTCTVTVNPARITPIKSLSLNKSSISLYQNGTATLKATVSPSNATKTITFTSSSKSIATVTSKGVVKGVKAGKATITVRAKNVANDFSKQCTVTVKPAPPTNVKATSGKKKATITYKKTSGADGYAIYRSTKKSSGFKQIKTLTGAKYINKGLKSKKTYYYKVKAYKTINGKKQFGKFSARVKVKVK